MTRVVVALDSFKGSISAAAAAAAFARGWSDARPDDDLRPRPMADGGEGTLDAFATAVPGARRMPVRVTGPDDAPTDAAWLLLPDGTGVVELAATSGIELLRGELRPWTAGTAGFGAAIAAALDHGVRRLALGIGSSASTDGGVGMLTALGARFADAAGAPVRPGLAGLADVATVDLSGLRPLPPEGAVVLSDVTNPLCGPHGAAAVFGPQKGLDAPSVASADAALAHVARLLSAARADPAGSAPAVDPHAPGAGAAGGTGFGLLVWGAGLVPGAAEVAGLIGLADDIATADLVVTGEGSFDGQSAAGKVPAFVRAAAEASEVPVALVAGRIAEDADVAGFAASVSLSSLAGSATASLADPARWLRAAGASLAQEFAR